MNGFDIFVIQRLHYVYSQNVKNIHVL